MTHQKHNIYKGKILSNCISSKLKLLLYKRQCILAWEVAWTEESGRLNMTD